MTNIEELKVFANEISGKFFFDYKIYKSKSSGDGFVVKIKDFKIND